MKRKVLYILSLLLILFSSCTNEHLQEAKNTVAQADSMWRAGLHYADSTRLALAYESLGLWQWCYADEYAHACYHYGRLLREKDNPTEAMLCFINATHSGTEDYHILGRVYSNMGSICHLADDFQLAYDMYQISADYFWRNHDTILFYHGLNNMAFELAVQGKKNDTETLIDSIEHHCKDAHVFAKTLETKAKLYFQLQSYDSVIVIINRLQPLTDFEPTSNGLKARAFWHIGNADSALYYANIVLNNLAASEQNKYNMLYIIANADSTLSNEEILAISAQRSDIETDILIPMHSKWDMAVQLLQQDLNMKPDFRWIYAILATIVIIGLGLIMYMGRKRRQHQLLSQQIEDMTLINNTERVRHEHIVQAHSDYKRMRINEIENNCATITAAETFPKNIYWNNFDKMCQIVDDNFYMLASKLRKKNILNETEIRLCILVLLNLNRADTSKTIPYALSSVGKLKDYTAKKLNTSGKNLREYLINMAVGI